MNRRSWDEGTWTTAPEGVTAEGDDLLVTARAQSDFWRTTSYGFLHDDGHGLLVDLPDGSAVEVTFVADLTEQFDQAGLLVRVDADHWVKAGVEYADGAPQLGAVVTEVFSDWSTAPVPTWLGRHVTVRASRSDDALTIRARVDDEPWQLVRLAPIDATLRWMAGPMVCAPTRSGLMVRFTSWTTGDADAALHP
jgi:regulation of enolase protein 1 (concanavalin A-like superfamily)